MQERIAFYKDMLLIEPTSKVFYQLALALRDKGDTLTAIEYLEKGLVFHPDFLEARIVLVELLSMVSNGSSKAKKELSIIVTTLMKYPNFWNVWAEDVAVSNTDLSVSLGVLANTMHGESTMQWSDILSAGLHALRAEGAVRQTSLTTGALRIPPADEEYEEVYEENSPAEAIVHTRSMADLLAEQGEIEQALAIYTLLAKDAQDEKVKAELDFIITEFQGKLATESTLSASTASASTSAGAIKEKLIGTLATLVERLDTRANAMEL